MRKLLTAVSLAVLAGLLLAAVTSYYIGSDERSQVKATALKYFLAWEECNPAGMYIYISTRDQSNCKLNEYIDKFQEYQLRPVRHEVLEITVRKNTARLKARLYWPDITSGGELPREESFFLTRENDGWKIMEDASLSD